MNIDLIETVNDDVAGDNQLLVVDLLEFQKEEVN